MKAYFLMIFISFLFCSTSFSMGFTSIDPTVPRSIQVEETNNSHLIEQVPYVSQETDFYCTYACPTMILNFLGCNTSLYEVLFVCGAGYSVLYSHPLVKRFLIGCIGTSNWEMDRRFLGNLYGSSYVEHRFSGIDGDESEKWDIYWDTIRECVSNDQPVLTIVDPSCLSSVRSAIQDMLGIPDRLWMLIPEAVFSLFPSTMTHMILIVGFNEENGTICYHDPSAALFGDASYGTYEWMDTTPIRRTMKHLSSFSPFAYMVGYFQGIDTTAFTLEQRFEMSRYRNIQKMSGDPLGYDDQIHATWSESELGVKGLRMLYTDLGPGVEHRYTTILLYRILCTGLLYSFSYKVYRFFDRYLSSVLTLSDFQEQMNYIYQLTLEKQDVSKWLYTLSDHLDNETLSSICRHDAFLLKKEADVCERLAENFSVFLEKGIWLPFPKSLDVVSNMALLVSEMIAFEEAMIRYP
jgi:hypothetical protein